MSKLTLPRRVTQIAFLLLTGEWLAIGWLRCPYGVPFVSCMSCPLRACPGTWLQPYFLALLGVSSLIVGRAFCGWGCPMGLIEEAMGRLTSPRLERFAGFVKADRWMKWLKWPALALVVYLIFALNYPADRAHAYVVRSTSAFDLASVKVAWSMGVSSYAIRAAVLGVALIGALVVMRAWCRYLCPLGATLGLLGKLSLVKLRRDETRCRSCASTRETASTTPCRARPTASSAEIA